MAHAELYIHDLDDTAEFFLADSERLSPAEKRDGILAALERVGAATGHDLGITTHYSPHGWVIDGSSHYTGDDPEYAVKEELDRGMEALVNGADWDGRWVRRS